MVRPQDKQPRAAGTAGPANSRPVALVTNVAGFAGPPAVDALLADGFRVFAHDAAFEDDRFWEDYTRSRPGAERVETVSLEQMASWVAARSGRLDVVVSNDHHPAVAEPSEEASLERFRENLEKLAVAPMAIMKGAIPVLRDQGGGNVVMITSCRTALPMPGGAIPDAARAAANALVRAWAVELAPLGIAVNAVAPNFLYSEAYYGRARFIDNPRGRDYVASNVPAGRLGRPEEIGEVVLFLARTTARFMTGAIIDFAGGWPAAHPLPS